MSILTGCLLWQQQHKHRIAKFSNVLFHLMETFHTKVVFVFCFCCELYVVAQKMNPGMLSLQQRQEKERLRGIKGIPPQIAPQVRRLMKQHLQLFRFFQSEVLWKSDKQKVSYLLNDEFTFDGTDELTASLKPNFSYYKRDVAIHLNSGIKCSDIPAGGATANCCCYLLLL